MNYYVLLPLVAFLANLILGSYILLKDSKSTLNKLYSLFAFSIAIWALGNTITFSSFLFHSSFNGVNLEFAGASLLPAFLLHFCLVFSKRKITSSKRVVLLLYLPGLIFLFISQTTELLSGNLKSVYWGYTATDGVLYAPFIAYILGYITLSLFFIHHAKQEGNSVKEKKQATLLTIAICIPLIGGILTEVISPIINFEIIPLSTTLTTSTAVIIAYAITKYGLMTPLSFSIKRKLIAIFLVLLISISTSSIVTVTTISTNTMKDHIYAHLETTAQSRASHIETILEDYRQNTEMLATGNPFRDIVDPTKNYTERINQVNRRIDSTIESNKAILGIRVLDKNGIIIASNCNDTDGDKSNHELFLKGKEGTYIGEIHLSEFTSNIVISISSPIFVNDMFSGVLVVTFDAEYDIFRVMNDHTGLGDTGKSYIVNKDGYMITPSRFEEDAVLKQKVNSEQYRLCVNEHINGSFPEDIKEVPTTYQDYRDCTVLGIHHYIPEVQWCLLIEMDEEEALASITMMQNMIIILFSAIAAISLIFINFFAGSLSDPIIKLKDAANSIRQGNFDTKIEITSKDEIEELANAFSDMAKDLKEQQENLERKVAERTKELEKKIDELERYKKVTVGRELKMVELKKQIQQLQKNGKSGGNQS